MFLNKTFYYNVFELFVPFFKIDFFSLSFCEIVEPEHDVMADLTNIQQMDTLSWINKSSVRRPGFSQKMVSLPVYS